MRGLRKGLEETMGRVKRFNYNLKKDKIHVHCMKFFK